MKEVAQNEASRLLELFKMRAMASQGKFGKDHNLGSGAMVWQYLHGRRPLSLETGIRFARGLKVDLEAFSPRLAVLRNQLLGASGYGQVPDEYAKIPSVKLSVDQGQDSYTAQPIGQEPVFIAFRHDWLRSRSLDANALVATECPDDGMQSTLARGDLVVVDTAATTLAEGAVFAVGYEGKFLVRRLFRDDGAWWLACDNATSKRFMRKRYAEKHCFVIGRVMHRQSEII